MTGKNKSIPKGLCLELSNVVWYDGGGIARHAGRQARVDKLHSDGQTIDLPVLEGTEHEKAVDVSSLRKSTGYITYDDGFVNTGCCTSTITYIDGENGILRHRGYPIEDLAESCTFTEASGVTDWPSSWHSYYSPKP